MRWVAWPECFSLRPYFTILSPLKWQCSFHITWSLFGSSNKAHVGTIYYSLSKFLKLIFIICDSGWHKKEDRRWLSVIKQLSRQLVIDVLERAKTLSWVLQNNLVSRPHDDLLRKLSGVFDPKAKGHASGNMDTSLDHPFNAIKKGRQLRIGLSPSQLSCSPRVFKGLAPPNEHNNSNMYDAT